MVVALQQVQKVGGELAPHELVHGRDDNVLPQHQHGFRGRGPEVQLAVHAVLCAEMRVGNGHILGVQILRGTSCVGICAQTVWQGLELKMLKFPK